MKKQVWVSVGCALRDSTWIGAAWSWLLRFVGYAAGPLLFICLVYSSVLSMPGVSSPGAVWDLMVMVISNTALELGAMSMPELAAKSGDEEARAHADVLSVQLTRLFLAGVMWAGIEHMLVVANVPHIDAVKYIASFIFLVVRAVYTTKYMKCIHALRKSSHTAAEPTSSPVAPDSTVADLVALLEPHLDSRFETMRATLAVDLKPEPVVAPALDYVALALALAPYLPSGSDSVVAPSPVALDLDSTREPEPLVPVVSSGSEARAREPQSQVHTESGPLVALASEPESHRARSTSGSKLKKAGSEATQSQIHEVHQIEPEPVNEDREIRLQRAYVALVAEGIKPSGRALSSRANCSRAAATEWLRVQSQRATEPGPLVALDSEPLESRSHDTDELPALDREPEPAGKASMKRP